MGRTTPWGVDDSLLSVPPTQQLSSPMWVEKMPGHWSDLLSRGRMALAVGSGTARASDVMRRGRTRVEMVGIVVSW